MAIHRFKKGLDLPIAGAPVQMIDPAPPLTRVAAAALDFAGLKARLHVEAGDRVRRGQLLFEDKKQPGVRHTSPAAGHVVAIHRGARRALQSVVVELSEGERMGVDEPGDVLEFHHYVGKPPSALRPQQIRDLLVESGLWTALRQRPFGRVPAPDAVPAALFVTALDTNPLAGDPAVVLKARAADFQVGLEALGKLTDGPLYVCKAPGAEIPVPRDVANLQVEEFDGPHPAGLAGLHIQTLCPVGPNRFVWRIGFQDVVAVGRLFATGRLSTERVVSVAGPSVLNPRLVQTRLGANLAELLKGRLRNGDLRIVSGSVLGGRVATGEAAGWLGRFDTQVTVLEEGREREFVGWMLPGFRKFSVTRAFVSGFLPRKARAMNTNTNGSVRAMVPIGLYERVTPMDILPTFLLRSLAAGDVEKCEALGVLELEEEDLALCSYVCPGKNDYGPMLRDMLTLIEKEG